MSLKDSVEALVAEYRAGANPAPYTTERALIERLEGLLETHTSPSLCSQCGDRPAFMVKVGTEDGWCTACLDQAAQPVLSIEEFEAFLDEHNGVTLTGYVSRRVCKCGDEIGRLPWKDRYSIGPRGGRHPIPQSISGETFDEPHRRHIAEALAKITTMEPA